MNKHKIEVPATTLDGHQWVSIIRFLDANDVKSIRLTGSKYLRFHDPLFTRHLPLRMDLAPFFGRDKRYSARLIRRWLHNRTCLAINARSKNIHPARVASLIEHGILDSVTRLVISNCSYYKKIIALLANLPNVKNLRIFDHHRRVGRGKNYESVVRKCSAIVDILGCMTSLEKLDVEFRCIVSGRYLSVLQGMRGLRDLRLRGFNFDEGMEYMSYLTELEHLHLSHGIREIDVPEDAFRSLSGLNKLTAIHIENIEMTNEQIQPLCQTGSVTELVLKHCELLDGEALSSIGEMSSLKTLHIINSAFDEVEPLDDGDLVYLQDLKGLKTLSLLFLIFDESDILDLEGMTALETLNIGFHKDMCEVDFDVLTRTILPVFPSLKKLRLFGVDRMNMNMSCGNYEIELRTFIASESIELD